MKTSRYGIVLLAVLVLASCKNEHKEKKIEIGDAITVHFRAGAPSSKTEFAEQTAQGYYPVRWTDSDNVAVCQNASSWQSLAAVPSENKTTATFSGEFVATETYRFYAVSPAAAVKDLNVKKGAWLLNIPWQQTPGVSTVDPKAIIIGAATAQSTTLPNPVKFAFSHITAYLRLSLTNVPASVGEVKSIDIASSQPFAGDWYYNLSDGSFEAKEASRSVRLTTASVTDQWIACAPVDMSGAVLIITVNGNGGSVAKIVELPSGRQYAPGMVSTLSVDMTAAEDVEAAEGEASFLAQSVPGYYPKSGTSVSYAAGVNQMSRIYSAGKVTFSIVNPSETSIVEFRGIPSDAVLGDEFTLGFARLSSLGGDSSEHKVMVVGEDGALLWLISDAGDRFIVKK